MAIWKKDVSIEGWQKAIENTMGSHLQILFTEKGAKHLKAKMPVTSFTKQTFGPLNGGASAALAEITMSVGANACVEKTQACVGVDLQINHIKSVKQGWVIATSVPVHIGRSTQLWECFIENEQQALIAKSKLLLHVLTQKA